MEMAWAYTAPLLVQTGVSLGVFDALENRTGTLDELAAKTGASRRGLAAVLNALVGIALLDRVDTSDDSADWRYQLTPESEAFLVSSQPGYLGAFFQHGGQDLIPAWIKLPRVAKTGRPPRRVNQQKDGSKFFAEFVESLFPLSAPAAQALAEELKLSRKRKAFSILDLGAGSGVWGITLAKHAASAKILAVDWPDVLKTTRKVAKKHGVGKQLKTAAGDLLEADFGKDHLVATIGHILHSEGEARSRELLKRTFDALAPGGTVAIMEFLPNDQRSGPPLPLIFAVNMLLNTQKGDTFTFREISAWLKEAGFENPRLMEVPAVSPLILADKPGS